MFAVNVKRRTAGDQNLKILADGQQLRYGRGCLKEVLEIVEQKEYRRARGILQILFEQFERRLTSHFAEAERLNDQGKEQARIVDCGKRDKMNSARKAVGNTRSDFE